MAYGYGSASLEWNDSGTQSHSLNVPLQNVRPAARVRRVGRESLDYSEREVFVFGAVYEVIATVRLDDAPESLLDALIAGAKGKTVTYKDGTGSSYACHVLFGSGSPGDDVDVNIPFESDRGRLTSEYTFEIRLRKTNGTAFGSDFFDPSRLYG